MSGSLFTLRSAVAFVHKLEKFHAAATNKSYIPHSTINISHSTLCAFRIYINSVLE